jgi:hypothetical protein
MYAIIDRKYLKPTYTIGKWYFVWDNETWDYFCDTLEDTVRDLNKDGHIEEGKIYGKTAIGYGIYDVIIDWSPKFNKRMLHILNVHDFDGIRIHGGAIPEHTLGCPLVGYNKKIGELIDGIDTSKKLFDIVDNWMRTTGNNSFKLHII